MTKTPFLHSCSWMPFFRLEQQPLKMSVHILKPVNIDGTQSNGRRSACAVPTLSIIAVLLSGGSWGRQEAISTANHLCLDAGALIDRLACSAAGEMNWSAHRGHPLEQTHTNTHTLTQSTQRFTRCVQHIAHSKKETATWKKKNNGGNELSGQGLRFHWYLNNKSKQQQPSKASFTPNEGSRYAQCTAAPIHPHSLSRSFSGLYKCLMSPFKRFRPSTKLLPLSSDWLRPRGEEAWVQCHWQLTRWWKKPWRRGPLLLPFNLERGCGFTAGLLSNRISLMLKDPLVDWFCLH